MAQQLARIGVGYDHPQVRLFAAERPETAGDFPNIGTRGCFLSHLNVLKDAVAQGFDCILVLEDDAEFTSRFCNMTTAQAEQIATTPWEMFYFGSQYTPDLSTDVDHGFFTSVAEPVPLKLGHATMLKKAAFVPLVPYLEAMLTRKIGDAKGGPMHVDGAYSWFKNDVAGIRTMVMKERWIGQRASRTDIHDLDWKENIPFINALRRLKNLIGKLRAP